MLFAHSSEPVCLNGRDGWTCYMYNRSFVDRLVQLWIKACAAETSIAGIYD